MDTDLERFVALYQSVGIEFQESGMTPERLPSSTEGAYRLTSGEGTELVISGGYSGFYTAIRFDSAGKFVSQGSWE